MAISRYEFHCPITEYYLLSAVRKVSFSLPVNKFELLQSIQIRDLCYLCLGVVVDYTLICTYLLGVPIGEVYHTIPFGKYLLACSIAVEDNSPPIFEDLLHLLVASSGPLG